MLKIVCLVALVAVAFGQNCKSCNEDFGNAIFNPTLVKGCLEGFVFCWGCSERLQVVTNDGKVLYEGARIDDDNFNYGGLAKCNGNGKWAAKDQGGATIEFDSLTCKDVGECIKG